MTLGLGRPGVIGAAVDVGSTSVHLLVASIVGSRVGTLVDESAFLGLGAAATERGVLGRTGIRELVDTLARFATTARDLGAGTTTFVGTDPLRRLADASRIVHEVDHATGVPLHVLTHEEEGLLTLIGATGGRPAEREVLVVDIGGGSSEFVRAGTSRPPLAIGLPTGAARLTAAHVAHDPPTDEEMTALRIASTRALTGVPDASPTQIILVGGTASNLAKLAPPGADGEVGRRLSPGIVAAIRTELRSAPSDQVATARGIRPERARLLPAGAAIVAAILDRFGIDEATVSEAGIRDGTVLAVNRGGVSWRDRLAHLAGGRVT